MMTVFCFFATCPKGLGSLLVPEIEGFGAIDVRETVAGIVFTGSLSVGYRACLHSRFANRILLKLNEFSVESSDDLYEALQHIPWCEHLRPGGSMIVDFSGCTDDIRNTRFGAQRCKDAVVDQFRSRGLERPSVDIKNPDLRLNVRLHKGKLTVTIDLSGSSLHRRGYRIDPGEAPLKENLAAAVLTRAGWPGLFEKGWPLIDPMCGSGTLLVEAAMMATRFAPGLNRSCWGFDGWLGHSPQQWNVIVADARSQIREVPEGVEIRGYDGDILAVRRAESVIAGLGLEKLVRIRAKGLNQLIRPSHRSMPEGLLVCNPPWGGRLGEAEAIKYLYRQLGETLHAEFQGWRAGVLAPNLELGRVIGLRSHKQYGINNGAIDIQLLLFELNESNHLSRAPTSSLGVGSTAGHRDADHITPSAESAVLISDAEMFVNRLRKNQRRLKPWLKQSGVSCYRLYDADIPEYAVAVDVYEGRPHVAEYAPPKQVNEADASRRFEACIAGIRSVLDLSPQITIAIKRRQRQRGREQYSKFNQIGERFPVTEGKARLLVNLYDYLDTGLFLDNRPLRLRLVEEAKGKHFLNLFCYTGAATIHAALGGATTSTSVDLSNTYLSWFRENLALNGLSERQHRAERADVMAWLENCKRSFDLIMLDPPSFSNSKSTGASFDVIKNQIQLVELAMNLLALKGTLYFSSNRRGFRLAPEIQAAFDTIDITSDTIPEDFSRSPRIHQCWQIRHKNNFSPCKDLEVN